MNLMIVPLKFTSEVFSTRTSLYEMLLKSAGSNKDVSNPSLILAFSTAADNGMQILMSEI